MCFYKAKKCAIQFVFVLSLVGLISCTKENTNARKGNTALESESFPIENLKLKNCHFKFPTANYVFGATITPNIIQCEEGVPKKVEQLTPAKLPDGIHFDAGQLSLVGTANERVIQAPYDFYLENESGYVIIKIQISIQ